MNSDITIERLRSLFATLNRAHFGGRLPEPKFLLTHNRTILGQFCCTRMPDRINTKDHTIKISTFYDISEETLRDIVAHEMIHYYIVYNKLRDTSPHGVLFRREMARLNAAGLNITIRSNASRWTVAGRFHSLQRLVMALTTDDGRYMLTVVNPKYMQELSWQVLEYEEVATWQWFVTEDDHFASFSVVRSLRGKLVTEEEFERRTSAMKPLTEVFHRKP